MKKSSFGRSTQRTKKIKKPINNWYFWIWLWMLWVILAGTFISLTTEYFAPLKTYFWWWVLVAIFLIIAIVFFIFWFKNLQAYKAEKIKSNQTKISK